MARANYDSSDDELPAPSDILSRRRNAKPASKPACTSPGATTAFLPPEPVARDSLSRKNPVKSTSQSRRDLAVQPLVLKPKNNTPAPRRQRLLRPAAVDSRLVRQATAGSFGSIASLDEDDTSLRAVVSTAKRTPGRAVRKTTKYSVEDSDEEPESDSSSESEGGEDIEESLWCGSDGDHDDRSASEDEVDEAPWLKSSTREPFAKNLNMTSVTSTISSTDASQETINHKPSIPVPAFQYFGDVKAPILSKTVSAAGALERPSSSSSADYDAVLKYSPPRRKSPCKLADSSNRPCTPPPPASPSKPRLVSPSKKNRIPTPPHRPSLDAFWSAEVVNSWNDQHSPRKTLQSPQKQLFDDRPIPKASPQKRSPTKKDPARKSFEQRKHQLAEEFLKELDENITGGKISSLAAECGGVKLVWNKTLNTTAGRANWKRESITTHEDGTSTKRHRHHASIELAEKVIDDEDRLVNVIAHEFCHLANFMISNVRDNPHGKEFKEWAKKVTRAFNHRNINVTTKHAYAIDYKYIWTCVSCGHEFKRHSKSIDPAKHRCGSCKAELMQTKPVVRQKDPNKGPSEYQVFMKENFQRIKRENDGKGHKEIMEILGKEYREHKAKKATVIAAESDLTSVTRAIETIALDD